MECSSPRKKHKPDDLANSGKSCAYSSQQSVSITGMAISVSIIEK